MHVHVTSPEGEAKFWLEPILALAGHTGLSARELARVQRVGDEATWQPRVMHEKVGRTINARALRILTPPAVS